MARYVFPLPNWRSAIGLHHDSEKGAADLFAAPGTPVRSITDGKVTGAGYSALGGNWVSIVGDDGLTYYFAHLIAAPLVSAGQRVQAGQQLGGVGETGNAAGTGAHLHIGIGHGINEGDGPQGGAGVDFDAVGFLRSILAGAIGDVLPVGFELPGVTLPDPTGGALGQLGELWAIVNSRDYWARVAAVCIGLVLVVLGVVAIGLDGAGSEAGQLVQAVL